MSKIGGPGGPRPEDGETGEGDERISDRRGDGVQLRERDGGGSRLAEGGQWTEGDEGTRRGLNNKRERGLDMGSSGGERHGRMSGVRYRITGIAMRA